MKLYGLKNCDTCRTALKELRAAGHEAELVDVRAQPLTSGELARFLDAFGDSLVNRRSATWRSLSDEQRGEPQARLLAEHPALMKRPVISRGDELWLGWDSRVRAELLG